jgi:hypothetical protein
MIGDEIFIFSKKCGKVKVTSDSKRDGHALANTVPEDTIQTTASNQQQITFVGEAWRKR